MIIIKQTLKSGELKSGELNFEQKPAKVIPRQLPDPRPPSLWPGESVQRGVSPRHHDGTSDVLKV